MRALGRPQDMFSDKAIQLQPIFAQWIQNIHLVAPGKTAPNALATLVMHLVEMLLKLVVKLQ